MARQQHTAPKYGYVGPAYGARQCRKVLTETWLSWAGHPTSIVTDRGAHFKGKFAQYLAQHGVHHHNAPLESPPAKGEMHGVIKALMRKTVQESQPSNIEEMETVRTECVATKNDNELSRHV